MQAKHERVDKHDICLELQPIKHMGAESSIAAEWIVNGFREANAPTIFLTSKSDAIGNTAIYLDSTTLLDYEIYAAFEQYVKYIDSERIFRLRINEGGY